MTMKKVKEERTILTQDLQDLLTKIDFSDTFSTTNHIDSLAEITQLIFNTSPQWIASLFKIRNSIAKHIGLKTEVPEDYTEVFKVGGYVKFFKIYAIAPHQIILGANDSHLNFRAIIQRDASSTYNIRVVTLVEYHNALGKIYMTIVKPFHRIVLKGMLKNAFKNH